MYIKRLLPCWHVLLATAAVIDFETMPLTASEKGRKPPVEVCSSIFIVTAPSPGCLMACLEEQEP